MVNHRRARDSLLMRFLATAAGVAVGIVIGVPATLAIIWLFVTIM